jgi:hypothetical protein
MEVAQVERILFYLPLIFGPELSLSDLGLDHNDNRLCQQHYVNTFPQPVQGELEQHGPIGGLWTQSKKSIDFPLQ